MISQWATALFLCTADCKFSVSLLNTEILMTPVVVMILRVWAIYNRSRFILSALLILFSLEIICFIFSAIGSSIPKSLSGMFMLDEEIICCTDQFSAAAALGGAHTVGTSQILDYSICVAQPEPFLFRRWAQVGAILQIAHGAATCILVAVEFVRQSLQMYRVTKQWQLNRYMNLLAKQAILYFFVYVYLSFIHLYSQLLLKKRTN